MHHLPQPTMTLPEEGLWLAELATVWNNNYHWLDKFWLGTKHGQKERRF